MGQRSSSTAAKAPQAQQKPQNDTNSWSRKGNQSQRVRRQRDRSSSDGDFVASTNSNVSPENRKFLITMLRKHFLFAGLEDEEHRTVIGFMKMENVAPKAAVFMQGDKGDCCYFIQSGQFTVSIDEKPIKQLGARHTFGELALLYDFNRTASVTCKQAGDLWKMDGSCFRNCMDKLSKKHMEKALGFFQSDPTFSSLKEDQRMRLAASCSVQSFQPDEQILREGEVGDWMFIVIEGNVQTVDSYGNSAVKRAGTILGSAALMHTKQQHSAAKAVDNVKCLAFGKSSLERLLGPIEDVLRRSAIKALLLDNCAQSKDLSFFTELTDVQQNLVLDKFEVTTFEEGEAVISQGSWSQLIMVIEGEVAVLPAGAHVNLVNQPEKTRAAATKVLTNGMAHGGRALFNNSEMKEPAVALTKTSLHRINHKRISEALKGSLTKIIQINEVKKVLGNIFLFKNLTDEQVELTVHRLVPRKYSAGDVIVQQGEEAKHFYLIQSGTVQVSKDKQQVRSLGRWDYFGERGLLLQERRSATCRADEACVCLSLEQTVFADIVGKFRKELENRMNLQDLNINMADLRMKAIVGRGSFGIVKLVQYRDDNTRNYALKCVSKKQVVKQQQQKSICMEREINAQCYHPCIMQFIKTFQDAKNVYFLTEFLGGGDLFYAIREIGNLEKEQVQFYGGSIIAALEYVHARSIIYRDLKPENVLLDLQGNVKLVDFGCCKKARHTNTIVGTPEYFAPEVILGKGYTCVIDWWSLGVMMHEFVVGPLPFGRDTEDQLELFSQILEAPLSFPHYVTDDTAICVISGLLERKPELRLGASTQGAKEIKGHSYFADFDWDALVSRSTKPPWVPNLRKLKQNWEMQPGGKVFDDAKPTEKSESGMEWAVEF